MFPSQRKGRNGNRGFHQKTQRFPPANLETHAGKLSDTERRQGCLLIWGGEGGREWNTHL